MLLTAELCIASLHAVICTSPIDVQGIPLAPFFVSHLLSNLCSTLVHFCTDIYQFAVGSPSQPVPDTFPFLYILLINGYSSFMREGAGA
jgi:hypothetical protein